MASIIVLFEARNPGPGLRSCIDIFHPPLGLVRVKLTNGEGGQAPTPKG